MSRPKKKSIVLSVRSDTATQYSYSLNRHSPIRRISTAYILLLPPFMLQSVLPLNALACLLLRHWKQLCSFCKQALPRYSGGRHSGGICGPLQCLFRVSFCCLLLHSVTLPSFAADQLVMRSHPDFVPTPELSGKVEFWKLIFTKYGKSQTVFHFRDHPEVIYSVLDFSDYGDTSVSRKLAKKKRSVIKKERKRIQKALRRLADGSPPSTEFERRIERLFTKLKGNKRKLYRFASEAKQVRAQTGIRERFREGIKRSRRYLYAIEEIFRAEGLPVELVRLPLVESSFNYQAYSSKGAAGIWQFMPATGKRYMRINSSVDERLDPISASRSAAKYLANAHDRLKSWPLAVTSYNHGVAGMMRAVKQTGSRNIVDIIDRYESRTFGFASKNFFVELLAAIEVEENWRAYFPDLVPEEPWRFDEVRLGRATRYSKALSASGLGKAKFDDLNRALRPPIVKGRRKIPSGFTLKVAPGTGAATAARLGNAQVVSFRKANQIFTENYQRKGRAPQASGSTYRVRRGDTLGSIAQRFSTSTSALKRLNGISNPRALRAGSTLKLPQGSHSSQASGKIYKVRSGDNLTVIAKRHGMKVSRLRQLNPRVSTKIFPGQKLVVE